jgi:hypothetical protein
MHEVDRTTFKSIGQFVVRCTSGKVGQGRQGPGNLAHLAGMPANLTRASKTVFSRTLKHMMTGLGVLET